MDFPPELADEASPWPLPMNGNEPLLYNVPPSEHSEDFQFFSVAGIDAIDPVTLRSPPQRHADETVIGKTTTSIQPAIPDLPNDDSQAIDQSSPLLTFRAVDHKTLDIYNSLGQPKTITIAAHLSGIFNTSRNAQGEIQNLVCYRRNLFHIDGSILVPSDVDLVSTSAGQSSSQINKLYAELVAFSNQNGEPVKIVALSRTPRMTPNLAAMQSPLPKQLDFRQPTGPSNIHTFRLDWSRLQFRTATAKAGGTKERRSQNFFQISIQVNALIQNGTVVTLCEASTLPIVVRGRSPKNFRISREVPPTRRAPSNLDTVTRPEAAIPQFATPGLSLPMPKPIEVSDDIPETDLRTSGTHAHVPSHKDLPPPMPANIDEKSPSIVLGDNARGDATSVACSESVRSGQKNPFYRYLPLAADDRTPAVHAVYQPHYVHHKITIPTERLGLNKRYFGEPLNAKSAD